MELKKWIKEHPKLEWVFYGLLVLIAVLLFIFSSGGGEKAEREATESAQISVSDDIERKLESVLSAIAGAGNVRVMVTYEQEEEIVPVYAVDSQISETTETKKETPVTLGSGNEENPMVLTVKSARVRGAVIVAEGAKDIGVRNDLLRAAQAVLDVPASKIEVLSMETQKGGQ